MIIRSQDKTKITSDLNLEIITNDTVDYTSFEDIVNGNFKESNSKISAIHNSSGVLLGKYSTEEKAIKVLDMIQNEYFTHMTVVDGAGVTVGILERPKVFQMPQDSEV